MKTTIEKITSKETLRETFNNTFRKKDNVLQFGQTIENPNKVKRVDTIDTLDLLINIMDMANNCYLLENNYMHDLEGTPLEFLNEYETDHGNTYNWSAPVSNDIDFKEYKFENTIFLSIEIQNGFGDIRGGYSMHLIFELDGYDSWVDIFSESNPYDLCGFDVDGYSFTFDIFKEYGCYDIYSETENDTFDEYDVYVGDYDECVEYVKNLKLETVNS
jgi:hypothetical protein